VARSRPELDQWHERLYAVNLHDGSFSPIGEPRRPIGSFAVSPDGRTIAYVGGRVDGPSPHDVYLQPIDGGAARHLTAPAIDRPVNQLQWIDNESLLIAVARSFGSELTAIGRDGRARPIGALEVNPSQFARAANGTIAFVGETAVRAPELWIKQPDAGAHAVTRVNERWASIPFAKPELVKYKSADGVEIEAALLRPLTNPAPRTPAPFVVLVH